ncbi:MAG: 50S ribosomal protein L10 [Acidobacteria bacterium]|nr:50S ribosomal protein L10 [Acidobacteriota bacterium]
MSKIRPGKVAAIDDVKARVDETTTALVTEYRGLTVAEISAVRRQLRTLGADYKVFKNTLVRRAISGTSVEPMGEFLEGPTAIAFVKGDVSAVAKALRDLAKASPKLVVKGGVLDGKSLTPADVAALADLPSRDVLLSMFAGALAAPLRNLAGLMKAVPQNLAYGLSALLEQKGGSPLPASSVEEEASGEVAAPAVTDETDVEAEAPTEATPEASEDVASEPAE